MPDVKIAWIRERTARLHVNDCAAKSFNVDFAATSGQAWQGYRDAHLFEPRLCKPLNPIKDTLSRQLAKIHHGIAYSSCASLLGAVFGRKDPKGNVVDRKIAVVIDGDEGRHGVFDYLIQW